MRQSAMRDVARARKQKRDYGQHNLVQYPVFVNPAPSSTEDLGLYDDDESTTTITVCDSVALVSPIKAAADIGVYSSATSHHHDAIPSALSTPPGLTLPGEFLILLELMPLTGLRLGIAGLPLLTSEPARLRDLFTVPQLGSRRLLSFLPSRYAQVSSVRYATDCIIAKLRQVTQPLDSRTRKGEMIMLQHYSNALKALQIAIDDENERLTAETLCAAELLGVFEVN